MKHRKIIHIDMDAYYASVEQMDNPAFRGKPLAVGGSRERGVVAAASYEARKFGVKSAMSSKLASLKCPDLIFVKPRFERYREISLVIREIFFEYTDLVEPLSLDEAFLDVTTNKKNNPSATLVASEIRNKIKEKTGLNASAGISYNKFLAKIASDLKKPNGQATILPKDAVKFLEKLPMDRFYGIGKVTASKMRSLGIHTGYDLKQFTLSFLVKRFGKLGLHYFQIVRGIHHSEVKPHRIRKSISVERTFERDISDTKTIKKALEGILEELFQRLKKNNIKGRTITLKIKYRNFTLQTRSKSLDHLLEEHQIETTIWELLDNDKLEMPIRLLGIGLSNLNLREESVSSGEQLWLDYDKK